MDENRIRAASLAIAAALLAAAVVAGLQVVLRPGLAARQRVAALGVALESESLRASAAPDVATSIRRLESRLAAGAERLPGDARLDDFVHESGRAARRQRVRIVQLQPGSERAETDARVLPVRIAVEGRFERIYAWMVALESAPRLVRVESLQARDTGSGVRAEVHVLLFMGSKLPAGEQGP